MRPIIRRYALIALSILGSATLLFSCGKKPKTTIYDHETLMTESSENRTITMMENGKRSYIFTTPLIEGYSLATNPYQEFRRGINMTTFSNDSLALINATVQANYAIYYERQRLWEAKGNVVIKKFNRGEKDTLITDTTEIYTQQLFWNATTEKIYSNVDTKVLQKDGWHFGVGFDADEELKNIHFRKYSSEMEFNMSQPSPKQRDSLSDDKTDEKSKLPDREKATPRPQKKNTVSTNKDSKSRPMTAMPGAKPSVSSGAMPNGRPTPQPRPAPGQQPPSMQPRANNAKLNGNSNLSLESDLSGVSDMNLDVDPAMAPPAPPKQKRENSILKNMGNKAAKSN